MMFSIKLLKAEDEAGNGVPLETSPRLARWKLGMKLGRWLPMLVRGGYW
jgi:hypothetical protein